MKKVYVAPQTEAIKLLADGILMASAPVMFTPIHGTGTGSGSGEVM